MRELVDREQERRDLLRAAERAPSLVVMIGRRRVGKSFLLEHAFAGRLLVSFQGDEQDERHHLDLLAVEAGRTLLGSDALRFETWANALSFFGEQARLRRLVVVLDEYQWLRRSQPALDSIVQRHWDRWEREQAPITLVLCGSALSLAEQLLDRQSPLFGRATSRQRIEPLDYRDVAPFSDTSDTEDLLRRWAVVGGTPQYQVWAGRGPLDEVIATSILSKDSPLYDEPRHLLREGEGIRDPGSYLSIMRAVAGGATQHNEIAQQAGAVPAALAPKLERLEDLGYLERRQPLGAGERRGRHGYHVADPFLRFWFRYVAGNRSRLERRHVDEVLQEILTDFDNVMGWAFEQCCRRWAAAYADWAAIGRPRELGSWWSRDGRSEIDLVGTAGPRYVVLGSCKWRRVVGEEVLDELRVQQARLGAPAARARLVLFARQGFAARLRARATREDVLLVTAGDLFG